MFSNKTEQSVYLSGIQKLVDDYLVQYPDECSRLHVLLSQLKAGDETLTSRANMVGHLTASALVVNGQGRCLLILHKFLKRWLQPGGHLDPGENPEAGALRELFEETGLKLATTGLSTIDIDSHQIPAAPKKGETEHLHHDFQFVFRTEAQGSLILEAKEIDDCKWVPLEDLASGQYGSRLARVAGKLLNAD